LFAAGKANEAFDGRTKKSSGASTKSIMKNFITAILIFIFSVSAYAQQVQQKPLTQTEYVKMLYDLQRAPAKKDEIVEAIRTRGIAFELTDGLRGLTTSKSRNDQDLKRAVEEAERRRQNPTTAKPPTEKEAGEILTKAREATLAAVAEMPDFVVKQQINRAAAYAGTNNFKNLDRLVVAVSYRASGEESYRTLSVNGVVQPNAQAKSSYEEVGGTSSTGEFVTVLAKIFKPESETKFEIVDTDTIRGHRALVFNYAVERDKAQQRITASGYFDDTAITGMKGRVWIDRENYRVLKIESAATEIPNGFPIRTATRTIEYDWTTIAGEKYLLPLLSDVRLTFRERSEVFETRNVIRFKEYQKYGSEVKILEGEEVEEPAPNN
jgi:hypothetical protein